MGRSDKTSLTIVSTNTPTATITAIKINTSWSRLLMVLLPTPAPTSIHWPSPLSRTNATDVMENGILQPSNYLLLNYTTFPLQTLRSDTPSQPTKSTNQRSRSSLDQSAFLRKKNPKQENYLC